MTKLEKKYPLVFECARTIPSKLLERGLKYYERGGGHTVWAYRNRLGES